MIEAFKQDPGAAIFLVFLMVFAVIGIIYVYTKISDYLEKRNKVLIDDDVEKIRYQSDQIIYKINSMKEELLCKMSAILFNKNEPFSTYEDIERCVDDAILIQETVSKKMFEKHEEMVESMRKNMGPFYQKSGRRLRQNEKDKEAVIIDFSEKDK